MFASIEGSINSTILPLKGKDGKKLGTMILLDDIGSEVRMKSTMSRYMDPGLAKCLNQIHMVRVLDSISSDVIT